MLLFNWRCAVTNVDYPRSLLLLATLFILAGCATDAHYTINQPLERPLGTEAYRGVNFKDTDNSDSLLINLAFSGGGTRAAALAFGVLEALDTTPIRWEGKSKKLLDEVDFIASVSGGSVTAAYFGLNANKKQNFFSQFPEQFLYKDFQKSIADRLLSVTNIGRLRSPRFGRIDIVQEYFDEALFKGATFGDMLATGRKPMVFVTATDMTLGQRFEFTQDQFDLLCSDLSKFPVARAVAASAAVPVVFSPVTLWSYADRCPALQGPLLPESQAQASANAKTTVETALEPDALPSNPELARFGLRHRPYIHLLDGGLADNTGVRGSLDHIAASGGLISTVRASGLKRVKKMVFISVNAQTTPTFPEDFNADVPGITRSVRALVDIPIDRNSYASMQRLRTDIERWKMEVRNATASQLGDGLDRNVEFYIIDISFANAATIQERVLLDRIPTSLGLDVDDVTRLRAFAAAQLRQSPDFIKLLKLIAQ